MAAQKGSAFLLKDNSTGNPATLGGMRSTSMSINGETVDVTHKESGTFTGTAGDDIGRVLLANAGIRSMSISASGVFIDSASENTTRATAFSGDAVNYDLIFADTSSCKGAFIITSYERAGEYNGEETYSLSMESSGIITYTNA
jgi:TP901-1 family phage major tail protein